jgi:sulfur carrier protein
MRVVLNGAERVLADDAKVDDAVAASGASPAGSGIAVAVDGEVIPRGQWSATTLRDGQAIEVLQAVQGG